MRAIALSLMLLLAGPAMANDKGSAPVTNFGMGLYAFPQQRMSPEEEQALSLRSLKRERRKSGCIGNIK